MKKSKSFLIILLVFVLLLCCAAGGAYLYLKSCLEPFDTSGTEYQLDIPSGTGTRTVAGKLEENGMIKSADVFYYYVRFKKCTIKAGKYRVNSAMSTDEILSLLESGVQEHTSVSIPEGYTLKQIGTLMEEAGVTSRDAFIKACSDQTLLDEYAIPASSFEGYLFPDTYFLDYGMTAERVVRILADTFYEKITTIPDMSDLTPDELFYAVRLASIVEKEYRVAEEAPLIASVFTNRLNTIERGHSWGLYSCATVVYIITDIMDLPHPAKVTRADTQIDNPYNTYKYEGLPPGAISNPGLTALDAAVHPAKTKYTYFTLVDAEKGSHAFTSSNEAHIELKYEYTVKN
ncbi:MAG: endolytic transglycosylase MltG [Treponema sp.]|nr:endolytic transglycosylase MltG [Candidatus Treponema caballi]